MNWPTAEALTSVCPLAEGYRYEVLRRSCIDELIAVLATWQPSWHVGAASVFVRRSYYENTVYLAGEQHRDVLVLLIRHGATLAGMFALEQMPESLSLYASLAVLGPAHRGTGKPLLTGDYLEAVGRLMGLEYIYTLATLKHRGSQRYFERMGYKLIGFVPGYDREEVSPGVIKRVQEAAYAKLLVSPEALLQPNIENMTPAVRQLYEMLFPEVKLPNEP